MKKKNSILLGIFLCLVTIMADTDAATAQTKSQAIKTNKDKVITIAVQGKIAPAQPSSSYITTWDGKPKMAIGIGGINYNLKIGDIVKQEHKRSWAKITYVYSKRYGNSNI